MNLGFTHNVERLKLTKLWVVACVGLLVLGAFQSTAVAQDMSFDLDEAETAPAEAPAEEAPAEDAPAEEAPAEDDVVSDLAEEGGESSLETEENLPKQEEVAEEIYAVQRMYVLRRGRFELSPSFSQTFNDQYVSHPAPAIGLNYWITNVLAIGANFLWYQGLESESDLNFSVRRSFRLAVPITEYQLGTHLNFTYVPIYGKFTMFNDAIFQWDSYLVGGVGMMRTRPVATVDPSVRTFDFDWRIAFNVGIGLRVFVTKWLSLYFELRDYIYLEKLENQEVALGDDRYDSATWIEESSTLTNNVTMHIGFSIFLPFNFDYRYPK